MIKIIADHISDMYADVSTHTRTKYCRSYFWHVCRRFYTYSYKVPYELKNICARKDRTSLWNYSWILIALIRFLTIQSKWRLVKSTWLCSIFLENLSTACDKRRLNHSHASIGAGTVPTFIYKYGTQFCGGGGGIIPVRFWRRVTKLLDGSLASSWISWLRIFTQEDCHNIILKPTMTATFKMLTYSWSCFDFIKGYISAAGMTW
jgi:hypothetical protein